MQAFYCPADDLVARHDGDLRLGEIAVHHVKVGATDPAGRDPDQNFARARHRIRHIHQYEYE